MYSRIRQSAACLMLALLMPSSAQSQVVPKSPIHLTINGVFFLCPQLVQKGVAPSNADLSKLGFETTDGIASGELWFKGDGGKGRLTVDYNPVEKRCTLNYFGVGYEAIAGVMRDTVKQNGLTFIVGGDRDGAKGDVYEGPAYGSGKIARFIVLENYTNRSTAVSYAER